MVGTAAPMLGVALLAWEPSVLGRVHHECCAPGPTAATLCRVRGVFFFKPAPWENVP